MKKASYKSTMKSAKSTISKLNKSIDYRGLNIKKNYSSFWMGSDDDRFEGLSRTGSSNDLVKLIKLSNYRRAITNFVKIVSNQDIPVMWYGDTSFTDGKSITLSTDIKDNNFDVTVGLALHEASHVILSDFDLLKKVMAGKCDFTMDWFKTLLIKHHGTLTMTYEDVLHSLKSLWNWIEDRRIDHYVFSTSPGYKAYYHKLYDYYWHDKSIDKGLTAANFKDASELDNWLFHIINMMNPSFNPNALPQLDEVVAIIDLHNIQRISSTEESLDLARNVIAKIFEIQANLSAKPAPPTQPEDGSGVTEDTSNKVRKDSSESSNSSQDEKNTNQTPTADNSLPDQNSSEQVADGNNFGSDVESEEEAPPALTPSELTKINQAIQSQRSFLDGRVGKKVATKKLQKQLDRVAKQDIEVQMIGGGEVATNNCLVYDFTTNKIASLRTSVDRLEVVKQQLLYAAHSLPQDVARALRVERDSLVEEIEFLPSDMKGSQTEAVQKALSTGFDMGALLGKKLQLHNESRERVDARLTSGKMDSKRLAHAGYGIENVFKQIHIDKYKKANLHISLDGSGSMNGDKWTSTVTMTAAIVKAAAYTQGISVQVSLRCTQGDNPSVYFIYDSKKNSLQHFLNIVSMFSPSSMTPEGMCLEAMLKKHMFKQTTSEVDSYFLNISDGEPGFNGYYGDKANRHTASIIQKMKGELSMKILSFFISTSGSDFGVDSTAAYSELVDTFNTSKSGQSFRSMYGIDASVVNPQSTLGIARELNKKFMSMSK